MVMMSLNTHKTLLAASVLTVAGCVSAPRMLSGDSYLVDTERGLMCHVAECYYLDLVNASHGELDVALAYGLPKKNYTWSTSQFVSLLVTPPGGLYSVKKLSDTEYQIEKNSATDAAFRMLHDEDLILYRIGGDGKSL